MQSNSIGGHSPAQRKFHRFAVSLPAFCAAIFAADAAVAQNQAGLEQIIVTARFRQENLQEIPLAISALSADMLAANGATSTLDIASWTPNVTIDQLGQGWGPTVAANIRGLGYGDFKASSEPTVTFYVDDVVLGRPTGAIMDLLDLERVEMLRGPQGTLFGKNAIGGVVRMVSRKPGEGDGNGDVEVTLGTYNRRDIRGAFETTLIDEKLYSRVSFVSKQRNGYMNLVDYRCAMVAAGTPQLAGIGDGIVGWNTTTNTPIMGVPFSAADYDFALPTRVTERGTLTNCVTGRLGDQAMQAARGTLRFTPNDKFEINFVADVTEQNDTSPYELTTGIGSRPLPASVADYNRLTALPLHGVPYDSRFNAPDIYTSYSGFDDAGMSDGGISTPNINDINQWGTSATFDINLDAVDVKLIVAHREFDSFWAQDSDGAPLNVHQLFNAFYDDQDSVELRVSGSLFNGKTSWTVGYFTFDSHDFGTNISESTPCVRSTSCIDRWDEVWVDNSAIFLNTQTDLTDRLSLTVGVRNSDDDKEIIQQRFNRFGVPCCGFEDRYIVKAVSSNTDPMVSLAYQVNDGIMVYGTYQEGFRGGGTSARPTATTKIAFGPETLENFEVGIKSDLFGDRVRVNASVFDMTYRDIQQGAAGLDVLGQPAFITTNAGEAAINGYEFETRVTIGEHWTIDGTLAHLKYKLTDLGTASPAALAAAGLNITNSPNVNDGPNRTPRYTASLNVGYYVDLNNGAQMSVRFGSSWRDDAWWGLDGDERDSTNKVPAHALSNFRMTWAAANQEWEAALFCTNCSNVRTVNSRLDFLSLYATMSETYVRPEEWGMSIKKNF
jgi:iron complex outermembrane receptor protein